MTTVPHVDTNRADHATDPAAGDLKMYVNDTQSAAPQIASKVPADSPQSVGNWPATYPHKDARTAAAPITHTKALEP